MIPILDIIIAAGTTAVATLLCLGIAQRFFHVQPLAEILVFALLAGLSVLAWRLSANTPLLNEDPIPLISPNDMLCPLFTYLFLQLYAAVRPPKLPVRYTQICALLTLLSFVINVITI